MTGDPMIQVDMLAKYSAELEQANKRIIALLGELEAARPVVEAADRLTSHGPLGILGTTDPDPGPRVRWAMERDERWAALRAAVDLYRSATSDHPSTTEEKP